MATAGTAAATRVTAAKWAAVRTALLDATGRFGRLVAAAPPAAMATKDWTVADTAAHVCGIASNYTAMVVADNAPRPLPEVTKHLLSTTVENIHTGLNPTLLRTFPERDPARLAVLLKEAVRQILALTADADPERLVTWLGGSKLPLAGLLAHLTNELMVHGRDIAERTRVPWSIPEEYAALFFELFLVEIIRNDVGVLLDEAGPPRPGRIAVEFRSAFTAPVTIVVRDGAVSVEDAAGRPDVRIRFRPVGLDLMLFHRLGRIRTLLAGAVRVRGPRPWLLLPFLRKVRLP
ncbi:maleylpyruvate isomerase N-terminal domain-containing protein [Catenulispora subtropica]|uniref:Maleylpyruvate isomerase family mycothiol-dependent enzyme n=1 Tax=Catenulispora subtropica TaxID=450798 RepID=A0ABN2T214_9ACTN